MNANKMKAIVQLRKTVYLLSTTLDGEILYILKTDLNINHIDLLGQTSKEKTINLFIYCQQNKILNQLFSCILNISKLNSVVTFIDKKLNIQELLEDVDIEYLSFSIDENSTCQVGENKFKHDYHKICDGCDTITVCKICGNIDRIETNHIWDNWNYKSPQSCIMRRVCRRCQEEEEENEPKHKWGEWHYVSNNSCDIERECTHCQKKETKSDQHKWIGWRDNGHGHKYNHCSHCHEEKYKIEGHWKGFVEWDDGTRDFWDVLISEKTHALDILGFFDKLIANITITTEINGKNYIIKQQSKVSIDGNKCYFKTKDKNIIVPKGISWNKDEFEGKITEKALSIKGKVNSNGKLVLQ